MENVFFEKIDIVNKFLSIEFLGNELYSIFLAIIVFFVVYFGLKFIMKHVHNAIKVYTQNKTEENIGITLLNFIKILPKWFFLMIEIYIPLKILKLPDKIDFVVNVLFLFVVTIQIIRFVVKIFTFFLSGLFKKKNMKEDKTAKKTIQMIVNILVWIIGILIFLTNIGIDLTPLVASLGVASIAVAFALQNILSDLFASFSIIMSRPFNVGDYIVVGEGSQERAGTVKDINLKATHLLSVAGQEIVIPNGNILSTEVINYGQMTHRRKRFKVGVTYQIAAKKLKKIPEILEKVIDKIDFTTFERCYLNELNSYSIDFYISYDIEQPEYLLSLDIHERVLLGIIEAFEKEGIEFAYPTQTLYKYDLKK
ncbi:MAG TPA: mechanosensitive ion channel family protein [Candidatus Absconditabacterales bacterium]|nr:mechanosensitive ion channel family protein [Candidatus Absconditabacterales bacterium]